MGGFTMSYAIRLVHAGILGALVLLFLPACQSAPPDGGIRVIVADWPGRSPQDAQEIISITGADFRCGVDEHGDFSFTPTLSSNRVEFPDGSWVEAESLRVKLIREEDNTLVGAGPHTIEILLEGQVKLTGPFAAHLQGWLGETSGAGESLKLTTGSFQGPMILQCPVELLAFMAQGRAMVFGSLAGILEKEFDTTPTEPPAEEPAEDLPPEQPNEDMPPEEPVEDVPPE